MNTFTSFLNVIAMSATLVAFTTAGPAFAQVTIINPDTQPVPVKDVDAPGVTPFQYLFSVNMPPGTLASDSVIFNESVLVAPGKLYVVEHVGFQGSCSRGIVPKVSFGLHMTSYNATPPQTPDMHILVGSGLSQKGPDAVGMFGAAPMLLYLTANTQLSGYATRNNQAGNCGGTVSVSGYVKQLP
jgi:hypothetical protein